MLISDAVTAAKHQEAIIIFPVWSGKTHHIYYDVDRQIFFVRRENATGIGKPPPLAPPAGAIQCVPSPDRSADFWCELIPTKPPA